MSSSEVEEETWEIEYIQCAQVFKERQKTFWKYFVKWKGYKASDNSWEPPESFQDPETLDNFWENVDTGGRDHHKIEDFDVGEQLKQSKGTRKATKRPRVERSPSVTILDTAEAKSEPEPGPSKTKTSTSKKRRYSARVSEPDSDDSEPRIVKAKKLTVSPRRKSRTSRVRDSPDSPDLDVNAFFTKTKGPISTPSRSKKQEGTKRPRVSVKDVDAVSGSDAEVDDYVRSQAVQKALMESFKENARTHDGVVRVSPSRGRTAGRMGVAGPSKAKKASRRETPSVEIMDDGQDSDDAAAKTTRARKPNGKQSGKAGPSTRKRRKASPDLQLVDSDSDVAVSDGKKRAASSRKRSLSVEFVPTKETILASSRRSLSYDLSLPSPIAITADLHPESGPSAAASSANPAEPAKRRKPGPGRNSAKYEALRTDPVGIDEPKKSAPGTKAKGKERAVDLKGKGKAQVSADPKGKGKEKARDDDRRATTPVSVPHKKKRAVYSEDEIIDESEHEAPTHLPSPAQTPAQPRRRVSFADGEDAWASNGLLSSPDPATPQASGAAPRPGTPHKKAVLTDSPEPLELEADNHPVNTLFLDDAVEAAARSSPSPQKPARAAVAARGMSVVPSSDPEEDAEDRKARARGPGSAGGSARGSYAAAHRRVQPKVRMMDVPSAGKGEPMSGISTKQRIAAALAVSATAPLKKSASLAVRAPPVPLSAGVRGRRNGGSLLQFGKAGKAETVRGVYTKEEFGRRAEKTQESNGEGGDDADPISDFPDGDVNMEDLFGADPDPIEDSDDIPGLSKRRAPSGQDILKMHGADGAADELPDFDDQIAVDVPAVQEVAATTSEAQNAKPVRPPMYNAVNSLFGQSTREKSAPAAALPSEPSSPPVARNRPTFILRLDHSARVKVELQDIKDVELNAVQNTVAGPAGKLYSPPTSERIVELMEAVKKAAYGSSARVQGKPEDEREKGMWGKFCSNMEDGCVFIQQVGPQTLALFASSNSKMTTKFKVHPSLKGIAGSLLVSRVQIEDVGRYADIAGEATDVKW